ncbi:ArsR/SmtB family transcription factor [Candidatus Solirubrobacter pratensis]|uniref:ArsR/SmtB family transcription factor n=1 Tax=Candidatus Solirubrobacter pratensis TaxID=1298857 RepID=UPI00040FCEE6|nr:metalloregulator ArsR/SmtB family transcription factor [Candidatus Solirubrobacter pratensis]
MAHGEHSEVDRLLDESGFARAAADSMQALATPSRLRILARLHAGAASVNEIAASVGMESSAVSHQLRMLRHLGLVVGDRDGRQVVYELHDDHVAELLEQVVSHVEHVRLGLSGRRRTAETTTG